MEGAKSLKRRVSDICEFRSLGLIEEIKWQQQRRKKSCKMEVEDKKLGRQWLQKWEKKTHKQQNFR